MKFSTSLARGLFGAGFAGLVLALFSGCLVDDRRHHHEPPPPPPHRDEVRADVIIR